MNKEKTPINRQTRKAYKKTSKTNRQRKGNNNQQQNSDKTMYG